MKKIKIVLLAASLTAMSAQAQVAETLQVSPAIDGLEKFPLVRDFTVNAGGNEAYFTLQSPMGEVSVIAVSQKNRGKWSEPQIVSFAGRFKDLEPFLAPDGLRLYFASNRPLNDTMQTPKDYDIWYVERKTPESAWSLPVNLGAPVNTKADEYFPSVTNSLNVYFTSTRDGTKGKDDIFLSRYANNTYEEPVSLSDSINTNGYEFNSYISPDESFLIFTGYLRKDGFGHGDLYISYHLNGQWSKAENMGKPVNSPNLDYCPFVDIKNKTLYFTSYRSSVNPSRAFWSSGDFINEVLKYENGQSRIYKIRLSYKHLKQ